MVEDQLVARRISDRRVLDAMREVPRHCFVPKDLRERAYADGPLPIGKSQTISQPYIVALMTELLELQGDETVLEVGTGSGYQAAVLSHLAGRVYTIERYEQMAERARRTLDELGCDNVEVVHGDGSGGLPEKAPFDGIIVTAAAPDVPQPLLEQLAEKAYLVVPVGTVRGQYLQRWQRKEADYVHDDIVPVAFVPLRGKFGWQGDDWW